MPTKKVFKVAAFGIILTPALATFQDSAMEELLLIQGGAPTTAGRNTPHSASGTGGSFSLSNSILPPLSQNQGNLSPGGIGSSRGGDLSGAPSSYGGDSNGNASAAEQYINGLPSKSTGWCARSSNNILSSYTGVPTDGTAGANAGQMGPVLQSRYGMTPVADTGQYQNGDTRVLQSATGGYGHIEVYMNGRWASDFQQRNSSVANSRYSSSQLYRLPSR